MKNSSYRITSGTFSYCRCSSLAMAEREAEEWSKEYPSEEFHIEFNEFDDYFYSDWRHVSTWKDGKEIMAQTRLL